MPRTAKDFAIVLLLIAFGAILFFTSLRDPEATKLSFIYKIFVPIQTIGTSIKQTFTNIWQNYIDLRHVRLENASVKKEIDRLQNEKNLLLNLEPENKRLRKLLDFKLNNEFALVVAQVVGEDAAGWFRNIFINRGTEDGIKPDMPVISPEGIVGKVVKCSASASKVMLIADSSLSVDCRIVRTRDRGLLNGSLEGQTILRYLDLKSGVIPGDFVATSGLDGVFPKGLMIGKVATVRKGPQDLFLEAIVTPAADFSALEEVSVVISQKGGYDLN
jgi:rod shape-determining protein MreC